MKKIYRRAHKGQENIKLLGTLVVFILCLVKIFSSRNTIVGDSNLLVVAVLVGIFCVVTLVLYVLDSQLFVVHHGMIVADKWKEAEICYISPSQLYKLEITNEMFNAVMPGDTVNVSFNTFNKKVETLEIL